MNNNKVEIIMVLDRSGSMISIKDDCEGGLQSFVDEQKKNKGDKEINLSLYQFDDKYETVYEAKRIEDVPNFSLIPRGATALLDAIGRTINTVGELYSKADEKDKPSKVFFVIITDGYENASKEFTKQQVADLIQHQKEKYNWEFIYLGADQDAIREANVFNIDASKSMTFTKNADGADKMFKSVSRNMIEAYTCNVDYSFKQADRDDQKQAETTITV